MNIIYDRKGTSKFPPMVLQGYVYPTLKKFGCWIWSLRKFRLGKFLTEFLRKTSQLVNLSRAKINYVLTILTCSVLKFLLWKMKSFLVKKFYFNFVKKIKFILKLFVFDMHLKDEFLLLVPSCNQRNLS